MTHTFSTALVNKLQIFNLLAISHATGYPVLLVGEHGTAKTKAATDYISGFDKAKTFKLELSEGTRTSELKGFLDYNKLVNEKIEVYHTPIADADAILINEVDKANSSIRNTMLGIMAEKKLMMGMNDIDLK
jgi:MoxR-like ATPase